MWKSVIRDYPEDQDERGNSNPGFGEWVDALLEEPWLVAISDLVGSYGTWTGTEEGLMGEVRLRVDRQVWESEDFPSDLRKLREYFDIAWQVSIVRGGALDLEVFDHREFRKKDLKEFDAPGWGPEAPILVERGGAGRRPDFDQVLLELAKYEDPLLLSFVIFTDSAKFARNQRQWFGSTLELAELLRTYYPDPGFNCPLYLGRLDWALELGPHVFHEHDRRKLIERPEPWESSDYRRFRAHMKTCAHLLKEHGIEVSWEKRRTTVADLEGVKRKVNRTRWWIKALRWKHVPLR